MTCDFQLQLMYDIALMTSGLSSIVLKNGTNHSSQAFSASAGFEKSSASASPLSSAAKMGVASAINEGLPLFLEKEICIHSKTKWRVKVI